MAAAKFSPFVTEGDEYLFGSGTHYDIYKKLGAHPKTLDGTEGVSFAVYAPGAISVHIASSFNICIQHSYSCNINIKILIRYRIDKFTDIVKLWPDNM